MGVAGAGWPRRTRIWERRGLVGSNNTPLFVHKSHPYLASGNAHIRLWSYCCRMRPVNPLRGVT